MKNESIVSEEVPNGGRESEAASLGNGTLLTVNEVAKFLRLKPGTIRSMARRGDLPAIKLGRVWRFRSSAIKEMLQD